MKYLIAGLGNVGVEYESTRHNTGFMALDYLAAQHDVPFVVDRYAHTAEVSYKSRRLHLIKPSTYMNLSGDAVAYWLHKLAIPKSNLFVVVDDIALPFGTLRLRARGHHAGHNGLAHIEERINGADYVRLKVGIGNNFPRGQQVDYVLSPFTPEEQKDLPHLMKRIQQVIYAFCFIGIERAMNIHNKTSPASGEK